MIFRPQLKKAAKITLDWQYMEILSMREQTSVCCMVNTVFHISDTCLHPKSKN